MPSDGPPDDVRCPHCHAKALFLGEEGPYWRFSCPNDREALNPCPGLFPAIGRNVWDWREPKGPSTSKLVLGDGRAIPLGTGEEIPRHQPDSERPK
jgi:hypothetical protein